MKKITLQITIEIDENFWFDSDAEVGRRWFYDEVLQGKNLLLHDNNVGDTVSKITNPKIIEGGE